MDKYGYIGIVVHKKRGQVYYFLHLSTKNVDNLKISIGCPQKTWYNSFVLKLLGGVKLSDNALYEYDSKSKLNGNDGIYFRIPKEIIANSDSNDMLITTFMFFAVRRGLDDKLEELFELPNRQEELKYSALVMLDADGLKQINDTYGHKAGDKYLCEIASLLQKIEPPKRIFGRQGGDEFVLFYYGCETEEELMSYIEELNQKRDNAVFMADEVHLVPIRFSFGYVLCHEKEENYSTLIREADLKMYEEKKKS